MRIAGVASALLLGSLLWLGGCEGGPARVPPGLLADDPATLRQGTQRVVINYSIAQGMAQSYLMSGRATPADLMTLVRYDHAALTAIRGHVAHPSWASLGAAAASIRALMDYTTAMDTRAIAPAAPTAAAR